MKINKIVAAGAAATLAVTSLASVASAKNPRSWSLVYNYGVIQANPVVRDALGNSLASVDLSTPFATSKVQQNFAATKGGITEAFVLTESAAATAKDASRATADKLYDGTNNATQDLHFADTNCDRPTARPGGEAKDWAHSAFDFDAVIPCYITVNTDALVDGTNGLIAYAGGLTAVVKGRKRDNANFVAIEKKTAIDTNISQILSNGSALNIDAAGAPIAINTAIFADRANAKLAYFPLYNTEAPEGRLMPAEFDSVDNIRVDASGMKSIAWATNESSEYFIESDLIATGWNFDWLDFITVAAGATGAGVVGEDDLVPYDVLTDWYFQTYTDANAINTSIASKAVTNVAQVVFDVPYLYSAASPNGFNSAIQLTGDSNRDAANNNRLIMIGEYLADGKPNDTTRGGADAAPAAAQLDANGNLITYDPKDVGPVGNLLVERLANLIDGINVQWRIEVAELAESNAWLPLTDRNGDGTLVRNEIWLLSDTADYQSQGRWGRGGAVGLDGATQTYTVEDYRRGTQPLGFGGLASQVADYFNKELNGTITFTFADVTNLNGRTWLNGGVPSTEVGLRNVLSGANPDDFALYFNYNATTGSLETVVDIDVDAGEVTFDISNQLDQLGGYTIGTIHDIYYGMTKATSLNGNVPGMWVSQVTLRAEDGADVSPAVEDDDVTTVDDDDDDVTVEDDDDDVAIEDDDDVAIEDDDDIAIEDDDDIAIDDDDDTAGEVEVISGDDDDANPHTGVALAVVPAIVAAAAIVVSKKRK